MSTHARANYKPIYCWTSLSILITVVYIIFIGNWIVFLNYNILITSYSLNFSLLSTVYINSKSSNCSVYWIFPILAVWLSSSFWILYFITKTRNLNQENSRYYETYFLLFYLRKRRRKDWSQIVKTGKVFKET